MIAVIAGGALIYFALVMLVFVACGFISSWEDPWGALRYAALIWLCIFATLAVAGLGIYLAYTGTRP